MAQEFSRASRVAGQIKRELAPLIQRAATENHFGLITISAVDLSPDLRQAQVFVTQLGGTVSHAQVLDLLNELRNRLRRHLAKRLRMRVTPALKFRFDESMERGARIAAVLDEVRADMPAASSSAADGGGKDDDPQ